MTCCSARDRVGIKRALVSVTDKTKIVDLCAKLSKDFGVEIISTGGTAAALADAGVPVTPIQDVTDFPEMMDGRVKTLHPKIHGGLLARRDKQNHLQDAADHGIEMIDLVVVNLYAFEQTVQRYLAGEVDAATVVENIDIGGPSMIRSAAKNHASVAVLTHPSQYDDFLAELAEHEGATTGCLRKRLAAQAYAATAAYDTAIAAWFAEHYGGTGHATDEEGVVAPAVGEDALGVNDGFAEHLTLKLSKKHSLRYGENPHQAGAIYAFDDAPAHALVNAQQLSGKAISYNNMLDADSCWLAARDFTDPTCVILKHQNPCGVASHADIVEAYERSFACDPLSAFGGIVACNREVPLALVERMLEHGHFVEVIIAPSIEDAALELLREKKPNIRVLITGSADQILTEQEYRSVEGGLLVQARDMVLESPAEFKVVTTREPSEAELADLIFGWSVVKAVKSNAVSVLRDRMQIGMGAGQPNRVQSARIALEQAGDKAQGAVAASDAFFPFRDGIDTLAKAGITAVIQPGGSVRDQECIDACNEHGMAMIFTGYRHFRH